MITIIKKKKEVKLMLQYSEKHVGQTFQPLPPPGGRSTFCAIKVAGGFGTTGSGLVLLSIASSPPEFLSNDLLHLIELSGPWRPSREMGCGRPLPAAIL